MKGQMDTQLGQILIDEDVISTYAGSVAVECFGIVGMAAVNMKDGLVKLLKKDYLNHGINVTIDADNEINISYIHATPSNLQANEYILYLDFLGHIKEPKIKSTIDNIKQYTNYFRFMGSYERI